MTVIEAKSSETPAGASETAFGADLVALRRLVDKTTHDPFGESEPYLESEFVKLNRALNAAQAASWVKEDVSAVLDQLRWLNNLAHQEKDIEILVTHDDEGFRRAIEKGAVGAELSA